MGTNKNKIALITICYNEEHLAQLFCNHYIKFCGISPDDIWVFDNYSTDKTLNILKLNGIRNIEKFGNKEDLSDEDYLIIKNNFYKTLTENDMGYDYYIVCDFDEFLYTPTGNLYEFIDNQKNTPNIFKTVGINVMSETYINDSEIYRNSNDITDLYNDGIIDTMFNKKLLFSKDVDIKYAPGCHTCKPKSLTNNGIRWCHNPLFVLHMKKIKPIEEYKMENYYKKNILDNGAKSWYKYHKSLMDGYKAYDITNYYNSVNIKEITLSGPKVINRFSLIGTKYKNLHKIYKTDPNINKESGAGYDSNFYAKHNLPTFQFEEEIGKNIAQLIDNKQFTNKVKYISDYGCGTARILKGIKENINKKRTVITGYEYNLDNALPYIPEDITVLKYDLENDTPSVENKSDISICIEVLEHLIDIDSGVKNLIENTSDNGYMIISVANRGQGGVNHYSERTPEEVSELFKNCEEHPELAELILKDTKSPWYIVKNLRVFKKVINNNDENIYGTL